MKIIETIKGLLYVSNDHPLADKGETAAERRKRLAELEKAEKAAAARRTALADKEKKKPDWNKRKFRD